MPGWLKNSLGNLLKAMTNVLYVAHGHPRYCKGGGELAAWRLYQHFSAVYTPGQCAFLAAAVGRHPPLPPGCQVMGLGPREWLLRPSSNSVIHDTAVNLQSGGQLHQALASLRPDLIHFHHYLHVGIDLLFALRRWFPKAKCVLTLHEYWAMCAHQGLLLRSTEDLCDGPEADPCALCLNQPEARAYLAIRSRRVQRFLNHIDHFIAPSFFLKSQYLQWGGLSARRISILENLPAAPLQVPSLQPPSKVGAFQGLMLGYFGQVSRWKGLDLILKALLLVRSLQLPVRLEINGLDPKLLSDPPLNDHGHYLLQCRALIEQLGQQAVFIAGCYQESDLPLRMARVDCVVMASIWYENSPMVIQESFSYGRPVLAPELGGMSEKVRHGINGLLFHPGQPTSLAALLEQLVEQPKLLESLRSGAITSAQRLDRAIRGHERLYDALLRS